MFIVTINILQVLEIALSLSRIARFIILVHEKHANTDKEPSRHLRAQS